MGQRRPVLSKFYGIVIRMAFVREFAARFHAMYGPWELVVGVSPLCTRRLPRPAKPA